MNEPDGAMTKSNLIIPENYRPLLALRETEKTIRQIKEFFQSHLAEELNLLRVTAPLFVIAGTGVNDNLNGVEKPVAFHVKHMDHATVEIVQSLAKWKRMMLADYGLEVGEGLYTDMNAIRPDEILGNLHSIYVDQWDWERVITAEEKNLEFLKNVVRKIYAVIKRSEIFISQQFQKSEPFLPEDITFVHSEQLEADFPDKSPAEREKIVCRKFGAVFIIGIGGKLKSGQPHDGRSPDYDDWSTPTGNGYHGLNGDILVYYPLLDCAFELSSMGIRVDAEGLERQLALTGDVERRNLLFHKRLLNNELPLSIGGGIGQSRLCMLYLRKAHIGEIQAGVWPAEMVARCRENDIFLL